MRVRYEPTISAACKIIFRGLKNAWLFIYPIYDLTVRRYRVGLSGRNKKTGRYGIFYPVNDFVPTLEAPKLPFYAVYAQHVTLVMMSQ